MENSPENEETEQKQSDPNSAASRSMTAMLKWLMGFFTLSNEERSQAGIVVGSQDRSE